MRIQSFWDLFPIYPELCPSHLKFTCHSAWEHTTIFLLNQVFYQVHSLSGNVFNQQKIYFLLQMPLILYFGYHPCGPWFHSNFVTMSLLYLSFGHISNEHAPFWILCVFQFHSVNQPIFTTLFLFVLALAPWIFLFVPFLPVIVVIASFEKSFWRMCLIPIIVCFTLSLSNYLQ